MSLLAGGTSPEYEVPQSKVDSKRRDRAIIGLWNAFRDLSDSLPMEEWSADDYNLWSSVTSHRAVQERLAENTNG
jgi:hypothetical protein